MSSPRFPGPVHAANPIAWALLSQTIWLPLMAIDLHDHWQSRLREQREIAAASARVQAPAEMAAARSGPSTRRNGATTTGLLLGASGQGLQTASQSLQAAAQSAAARLAESAPVPAPQTFSTQPVQGQPAPVRLRPFETRPAGLLSTGFKHSELLGGTLTLEDLHKPAMPSLAMAEQARWANSSDPLAPLPTIWREPMRKALNALTTPNAAAASIRTARVIHIPSSRIKASTIVPLAIQGDGSVDILSRADDPSVVDEIRHWSKSQPSGGRSGVTAALVHLEPLPAPAPALTPNRPSRAEAPTPPQTRLEPAGARSAASAPAVEPQAARPVAAVAMESPVTPAQQAPAVQATAPEPPAPATPVAPLPATTP